jgi:hypothetical protein
MEKIFVTTFQSKVLQKIAQRVVQEVCSGIFTGWVSGSARDLYRKAGPRNASEDQHGICTAKLVRETHPQTDPENFWDGTGCILRMHLRFTFAKLRCSRQMEKIFVTTFQSFFGQKLLGCGRGFCTSTHASPGHLAN